MIRIDVRGNLTYDLLIESGIFVSYGQTVQRPVVTRSCRSLFQTDLRTAVPVRARHTRRARRYRLRGSHGRCETVAATQDGRGAADVRDTREGSREGRDDTRARPHRAGLHPAHRRILRAEEAPPRSATHAPVDTSPDQTPRHPTRVTRRRRQGVRRIAQIQAPGETRRVDRARGGTMRRSSGVQARRSHAFGTSGGGRY